MANIAIVRIYLVVIAVATILLFKHNIDMQNARHAKLRSDFAKLRSDFAKLERRYQDFEQSLYYETPPRLLQRLEKHGVVNASDWVRVAILETGDRANPPAAFVCEHVTVANNPFCYHFADHSTMIGEWSQTPNSERIAKFANVDSCISFLKFWVAQSPPKPNEDFVAFLQRRGYNPNPKYYTALNNLKYSAITR